MVELGHVALRVRDLDQAIAFYRDLVGLSLVGGLAGAVPLCSAADAGITICCSSEHPKRRRCRPRSQLQPLFEGSRGKSNGASHGQSGGGLTLFRRLDGASSVPVPI